MRISSLSPFALLLLTTLTHAYTGDMTYYDPGMGSCGIASGPNDDIVALSNAIMQNSGNPNANPKCGSMIGIWNPYTKKHYTAKVVDTCGACKPGILMSVRRCSRRLHPMGMGESMGSIGVGKRLGVEFKSFLLGKSGFGFYGGIWGGGGFVLRVGLKPSRK